MGAPRVVSAALIKADWSARYQRLLARRTDGTPEAMAAEDARLVDLTSNPVRVDEPTPAQAAAGRYPKRAMQWKGLTIRIENEAGSVRRGTKPDGSPWETRMAFPYGEIARTEGVDGDPVDVFIGPFAETAEQVFVIHQRRVDDWGRYDEDKCMIGWLTEAEAREAFLQCYDDPRFLGPVTAMPVAEFVEKAKATRQAPKMIKAVQMITRRDGVAQRYHVADPVPEQPAEQSLADDMEAQMAWLDAQATDMGYAGLEDLVARNFPAFEQLAAKWREDHPVDVALKSFADEMLKARVGPYIRQGKLVNIHGYDGRQARGQAAAGQASLFSEEDAPAPKPKKADPARFDHTNTPDLFDEPAAPVRQTETRAFKEWFGASKVRDENGEPMRMYHITPHDFDTFHPGGKEALDGHPEGLSGRAIWFSPFNDNMPAGHNISPSLQRRKEGAQYRDGTRVMPVYLRMERPLLIDSDTMLEWAQRAFADGSHEFPMIVLGKWKDQIAAAGYDGIIFRGDSVGWGKKDVEYIVFDPNQIKSAIGNNGDFSKDSAVITKSSSAPRVLFVKSHIDAYTKKDGTFVAAHEDNRRTLYHGSSEHVTEIKNKGLFGGVFASGDRESAMSHGEIVHRIDLPEDKIMTQAQLDEVSDDELKAVAHWVDEDDLARLRELVIDDDKADDDDARILRADDAGEASWEAQRLRGALAKRAGFQAVEMNDEHGTSYLVLPGAIIDRDDPQMAKSVDAADLKSDPACRSASSSLALGTILFLKAKHRGDDRTVDMFAAPAVTHVETRVRKDGVVQGYHVASKVENSPKKVNNDGNKEAVMNEDTGWINDRFTYDGWTYFRPGAMVNQTSYPGQPAKVVEVKEARNAEDTLYRLLIDVRGHPEGVDENGEPVDTKYSTVRADELNRNNPPLPAEPKHNQRTIPVYLLDRTKAVLEKINRKAKKFGVEGFTMKVGEVRSQRVTPLEPHQTETYIDVVDIEVEGPQIKVQGGWSLEGKVDFEDGMTIVSSRPGVELPKQYRKATTACEHCNSDRQRNAVFVFKNDAGEYKQVGRQCLKDFMGHNPEAVLWAAREFDGVMSDIDEEMAGSEGGGLRHLSARADNIMTAAVMASRKFGFVSRKTASDRGIPSTSDDVGYLLFDREGSQRFKEATKDDREKAAKLIEWARDEFGSKEDKSDYEYNIAELLERDTVSIKRIPLLVSIIAAYNRTQEQKAQQAGIVDAYVGTVGERRDFVGRFISEHSFETMYGVMWVGKFATDEGVVVYKGSSPFWSSKINAGDVVKFTGTIKEHSEYKGRKQTLVQRCVPTKDKPPKKAKKAGKEKEMMKSAAAEGKPILFLKAKHRGDDRTVDMFGTHLETITRKDGHVQNYHVANAKPAAVVKVTPSKKVDDAPNLVNNDSVDKEVVMNQSKAKVVGKKVILDGKVIADIFGYRDPSGKNHQGYAIDTADGRRIGWNEKKQKGVFAYFDDARRYALANVKELVGEAPQPADPKDAALDTAIAHLKEDAKQKDIPAAEKKEDAKLVAKLEEARTPESDYRQAVRSTKEGPSADEAANPRMKFYVTIARKGKGVGRLAGPFDTHAEADAMVDRARTMAQDIDPFSSFDHFGTAGIEADEHKPGVLNDQLGLGVLQPAPSGDDHPAPTPRIMLNDIPEQHQERWKGLHREQHELRYWHLPKLRKEMDRHQGAINRSLEEHNEQKRAAEDPLMRLDASRAAAHQASADKAFERYQAALAKKEAAVAEHQKLHARMTALGKEKDKILPKSGDLDFVWASQRYRDTAEQQEMERSNFKTYSEHFKPAPMVKAIVRMT